MNSKYFVSFSTFEIQKTFENDCFSKYGTGGISSISEWHSKLFIYLNILIKKCQHSVILKRTFFFFLHHACVYLESVKMLCSNYITVMLWFCCLLCRFKLLFDWMCELKESVQQRYKESSPWKLIEGNQFYISVDFFFLLDFENFL